MAYSEKSNYESACRWRIDVSEASRVRVTGALPPFHNEPNLRYSFRFIEPLRARGKSFVIPPKSNRTVQRDFDRDAYKARHLIENFFCKLKEYRAIATRYDRTARNFLAAIHLAAAIIWLN